MNFPIPVHKAFLSPMAGITDIAFRSVCAKFGAGSTVTELISAKALLQHNKRTHGMFLRGDNEKCFGIQIFGSEATDLSKAAKIVEPCADFIDLNLGCPAVKVCRTGAGSELLKHPKKIGEIVAKMTSSVSIPVTVKTRIGINDNHISIFEILQEVQNAGASLLAIHGRTRDQGYSGQANWDIIKEVKEQASIPIVGNGDITTPETAKERLLINKLDFVSIGRGASGNPLLFTQINDILETGSYTEYSIKQRLKVFEEYLNLSKEHDAKLILQKLQAQHFTKGIQGASKVRNAIANSKTIDELEDTLFSFIEDLE